MSEKPERKPLRLNDYDYREEGGYFVTICTHERKMLFGAILTEAINLNALGQISERCWNELPQHFSSVQLDSFVMMPNHVHALVFINRNGLEARDNSHSQGEKFVSLGTIIGSFKSASARLINQQRKQPGEPVWQRGYYDRIVRGEQELSAIREYILYNPMRWDADKNNPLYRLK